MSTLRELSATAPNWAEATGACPRQEWFSFPYLGTPWEHWCATLRSKSLTISVVVPFWNAASSLAQCLTAIRLSSVNRLAPHRLEVILCDDGSSDLSWDIARSCAHGLNVKAYRMSHVSQPAAIDFAIRRASGDVVVFCDADMVLGCGALDELAARHERWANAVCFGFRTNTEPDACSPDTETLWEAMHSEAFSGDNRVSFDLPTLEPNMMVATDWLTVLGGGRALLDSQGSAWPRHRFVYGCLFSARLDLIREWGRFPEKLLGWGYGDTLMAARLEAGGAFLLPVTSAWGHHIRHDIRHPSQWFQGNRNRLAYEYLLAHPPMNAHSNSRSDADLIDSFTSDYTADVITGEPAPRDILPLPVTLARLGWWQECLDAMGKTRDDQLAAECLFRLGRLEQVARDEHLARTIWGVLSLHRIGARSEAFLMLRRLAASDGACAYAATASIPEMRRLADNYTDIGMPVVARRFYDVADILAGSQ